LVAALSLKHFDFIGLDRTPTELHHDMLSQLFRVIGVGLPPKDDAVVVNDQPQVSDAPAQLPFDESF
jgi:hypothetical protein